MDHRRKRQAVTFAVWLAVLLAAWAIMVFAFDCGAASGAEPKAVITGPVETRPGDLTILRSTGSVGKSYEWIIVPASAKDRFFTMNRYEPYTDPDGNLQIRLVESVGFFANRTAGVYTFVLAVAEGDKCDMAVHELRNEEPEPPPPPPPPNPIPAPTPELQALVRPVTECLTGDGARRDARLVGLYYHGLAEFVLDDEADDAPETTADLRQYHITTGKTTFGLEWHGRYPGLGSAIDKAMERHLGLKVTVMDAAIRRRAADILDAIAWAANERGFAK